MVWERGGAVKGMVSCKVGDALWNSDVSCIIRAVHGLAAGFW